MKKIVKSLVLIAAAAMGFTACQEEIQNDAPLAEETVEVKFVASSADTKTSVDTSGELPLFAWGENETFVVLEQTDDLAEATSVTYAKVDGKANITAEFAANAGQDSYSYVTVYPANGYVSATGLDKATLSLPAVQTMVEGSYDPNADLMVSEVVTTAAQPTEAQMVRFTRLAAVAKMSLKNFTLEAGDQVEQVIFTAEGKNLAGTVTADLADPHKTLAVAEGVNNVTVNTTSSTHVYFTVLPTALEAGNSYTVTVLTKAKIYIKKGEIPDGKPLAFESGMVTRFGVDMAEVTPIDKWILVKDASTLKQGDVVAIVAKDYDKALSTKLYSNASETSTSAKRDAEDITKVDNYLIGGEYLQKLILVTGTVDGTFSFYDEARGKFLVSTTTGSTYLINQVYCDVNTSFKITIDGTTAATITNTEGAYAGNLLRYNTNGYFVSNKNTGTTYKDVCIYRLEGEVGEIPVVAANVTVPASGKSVVIAEEGAVVATEISEVVFNYVGDWTITPSTNAEWLNVAYDATKNCLTYTAEANTGAKREARVTITATLEGQESLSWTFNVLQKGAPQEITIEAFGKLSKDENQPYKLTGKVVTLATSASTAYVLDDGNGNLANVKYLKTEAGDAVWGHDTMELKLGDIVTVTTYAMGSKNGGSSSLPSIYKGHYRLTTKSEPEIVGYEGGAATITVAVEQNGTLGTYCQPTAIEGTMPQSDFANFAYTTGDENATVTFDENNGSSRSVDVTFRSGLAEVIVNIGQKNHPSVKVGWFLVTDVNELKVNDKIIIAAKSPDGTLDYAIKVPTSNNPSTSPGQTIKLDGNLISDVTGVEKFTLEKGYADYPGTWAFKGDTYGRYLYVSSGALKLKTTLDKHGSWEINIESDGKATLVSKTGTSTTSKNVMMFNYTQANQVFSAYASTQTGKGAIYIYKYYN